jgi:hypothetical protein
MEKKMKLSAIFTASLLAVSSAQAAVVTMNFDGSVDTDITNDYAGLTITKLGSGGTAPVRTWLASDVADPILNVTAQSGSNIIGLTNNAGVSASQNTAIKIVFDTAVSAVSISAKFLQLNFNSFRSSGLPFLSAYSGDLAIPANFLSTDVWNLAGDPCLTNNGCQSGWDTLSISTSGQNIKSIVLGGDLPNTNETAFLALFDTLSYDTGSGGGGSVPEPSSILLIGLALGALSRVRRHKSIQG